MASAKGPGRSEREGISIIELTRMFPDDETAELWFEDLRWPGGARFCPNCKSERTAVVKNRKPMPYRCMDCRRHFSVKKGSVMEASNLGYQKWAFALYLISTNLNGISSMKLHRDLKIRQATAWHLSQRIRKAFADGHFKMAGPVEVDEAFFGGKEKNKHASKRQHLGRGPVGKTAVAAAKDRTTGQIAASVVPSTDAATLQPFVVERTEPGATVYTDDHGAYRGLPGVRHETVSHSVGEYVRERAHTNGVESFWAGLKRGYYGTYFHLSAKHLQRYVDEFSGRHNTRGLDTIDQMAAIARGMAGKRLRYTDLIA